MTWHGDRRRTGLASYFVTCTADRSCQISSQRLFLGAPTGRRPRVQSPTYIRVEIDRFPGVSRGGSNISQSASQRPCFQNILLRSCVAICFRQNAFLKHYRSFLEIFSSSFLQKCIVKPFCYICCENVSFRFFLDILFLALTV